MPQYTQANSSENSNLLHATFRVRGNQQDEPVAQLGRLLQRLVQPRTQLRPDDDAVHHDLDVVLELLVERDRIGEIVEHTVDARANVPEPLRLIENVAMLTLAPLHHRRGDEQPRSFGQQQHLIRNLLDATAC